MEVAIFFSGKDKSQILASQAKYKLLEFAKNKFITITSIEFINVDKINIDKFLQKYDAVLTEIIFCYSDNMTKYFNIVSTKLSNIDGIVLTKVSAIGKISNKNEMLSIDQYLINYIKEILLGGKSDFYLVDNFNFTYQKLNDFIFDYNKARVFINKSEAVTECKRLIAEKIKMVDFDISRLNQRKTELEDLLKTIK